MRLTLGLVAPPLVFLFGCSSDGASNSSAFPPPREPGCPAPIGAPADIASTPRADPELEALALTLDSSRITATQANYDRVARDIAAIRAQDPAFANTSSGRWERQLNLTLSASGGQELTNGQYHAWDCLNSFYGATTPVQAMLDAETATYEMPVVFNGVFNFGILKSLYGSLPDVVSAVGAFETGVGIPEDKPARMCVLNGSPTWQYVIDTGDSSGGLIPEPTPQIVGVFTVSSDGVVTTVSRWNANESKAPYPDEIVRPICGGV